MYAIHLNQSGRYFCKDHSKIILFNSRDEAAVFVNQFIQYSMARVAQTNQLNLIFDITSMQMELIIEEFGDIGDATTVTFDEIKRDKGM